MFYTLLLFWPNTLHDDYHLAPSSSADADGILEQAFA
jgi:hypothetical protein